MIKCLKFIVRFPLRKLLHIFCKCSKKYYILILKIVLFHAYAYKIFSVYRNNFFLISTWNSKFIFMFSFVELFHAIKFIINLAEIFCISSRYLSTELFYLIYYFFKKNAVLLKINERWICYFKLKQIFDFSYFSDS